MKPHSWKVEKVDGGALGAIDFWVCPVCGASGGGFIPQGRPRRSFLAGPAKSLSKDCDEARTQIREYLDEKILKLAQMGPKGISPHYASLLHDVIVWTPEKTDLTPLVRLVFEIESFHGRPSLIDVREKLVDLNFRVVPKAVSDALHEDD